METSCKLQVASCRRWRDASGFNLMELMITVAIIVILVAVGLPQYGKAIERNYRQQAQDILTTIYYGEQAYKAENNKFIITAKWNDIFMENPQVGVVPPITFAVTAAGATTFTATATRAGGGQCGGRTLTINEGGPTGVVGSWLTCP